MARLVLGPNLRYVSESEASIWVETDAPCTVAVLGHEARTFHVEGHHYAIVLVRGLQPGSITPYEVTLDGELVWPAEGSDFPPSVIRTTTAEGPLTVAFGSCRVCAPHEPPWSLTKDEDDEGREVDALRGLVLRMRETEPESWPHVLLMLGDQIYADEVAPQTREFIRNRRDPEIPPGETLADFEEYTRLYREAWSSDYMRWLLSTVSTAMIFDDHDVHDDWNTSLAWVEEIRSHGWWDERIVGGFMSYWIYQHIGNIAPDALEEDRHFRAVCGADDAGPILREFAFEADRTVEGAQWSYCRDLGPARLVMMDSRAGRVLRPGRRCMVDDDEWAFIDHHASRPGTRHLLLGTSLPWLLAPGMHHLEAWNEAVCDGAWGRLAAAVGEKVRQAYDLEHWAAFRDSFERLAGLVEDVATGRRGDPPATIVALSGDVHHAYLSEVGFRRNGKARSRVYQATCSPFRNPLDDRERRAIRLIASRGGGLVGRLLARSAGVPDPPIRWRYVHDDPWFDNMVAMLRFDGDEAELRIEKVIPDGTDGDLRLEEVFARGL